MKQKELDKILNAIVALSDCREAGVRRRSPTKKTIGIGFQTKNVKFGISLRIERGQDDLPALGDVEGLIDITSMED